MEGIIKTRDDQSLTADLPSKLALISEGNKQAGLVEFLENQTSEVQRTDP